MTSPRLELTGISKQYPAVKANDNISLVVQPGEIHALLGENGAGKSTLMKIVFGAVQPDAGRIQVDGQVVSIRNPHDAKAHGIAMVFQHFSLFDTLTAAENVWLGLAKPSRSLSQGRDAVSGSSLRVDKARAAAKPPTPSGDTVDSAPPAIITSASPYSINRPAAPMLCKPVVQAVTTAMLGPV